METPLVVALALTLELMLAAGVGSVEDETRTINLDSNGTEPYRETPFSAYITEVVNVDCQDTSSISLFSVTKEDYDNCTLPVLVSDLGTSIRIGDCPRVIRLVLATNIITNAVNYMKGGTYYYAAYGVNNWYEVVNADPCMEGIKFKIYIEEMDGTGMVSPSSTMSPTLGPTTDTQDTSSTVTMPTLTPTIEIKPTTTTLMASPTTESTETVRQTMATVTRPTVDTVIAEGVADSTVSHRPHHSLVAFLISLVLILTCVCKLL